MRQETPLNLQRAIEIATQAHRDQNDKAGAPYLLHPLRLMMSLETEDERIVGVLHDVVEDGPGWTFERLEQEGFSRRLSKLCPWSRRDPRMKATARPSMWPSFAAPRATRSPAG